MMLVLVGSDGVIMIFVFVEIHYWKLPELATHVGVDNGGEGAAGVVLWCWRRASSFVTRIQ